MFHALAVRAAHRLYTSRQPGVVNLLQPLNSRARLRITEPSLQPPTLHASRSSLYFEERIKDNGQRMLSPTGEELCWSLQEGDCVLWTDLVRGGARQSRNRRFVNWEGREGTDVELATSRMKGWKGDVEDRQRCIGR